MKHTLLPILLFLVSSIGMAQTDAREILERSIQYHDPDGSWSTLNRQFNFRENRPDGSTRSTTVKIDNNKGYVKVNRNAEMIVAMTLNDCELIKGDKDCEYASMIRNYYLYLWGLPMKLLDEGTPLDSEVVETQYQGIACYQLRVPYEKDTWYFFIDRDTYRMVAYMFYKDEAAKKGEYILLDKELTAEGMKIPKERSWYTLPDSTYLATDVLISVR